jgi:SET domain-containing protein
MALLVKTSQLPNAGKGLFTTTPIKKGSKVIEYKGEIIDWKEYEKRVKEDKDGYLLMRGAHRNTRLVMQMMLMD